MPPPSGAGRPPSLTREACYRAIAEKHCAPDNGIGKMVDSLFGGIFRACGDKGVKISPEIELKIRARAGREIERHVRGEYVNRVAKVYETALASLSEEALNAVAAEHPDYNKRYAEVFQQLLQMERTAFSTIKKKLRSEIVESAIRFADEEGIIREIVRMAAGKKSG